MILIRVVDVSKPAVFDFAWFMFGVVSLRLFVILCWVGGGAL